MKNYLLTILALFFALGIKSPVMAQKADDPQRDTQIWPDVTATIKLDEKFSLILFGTIRFGRDDTALISQQAGIGFSHRFSRHLTGGVQYRHIANEPTPGRQSTEHRVFAELTPRTQLKFGFQVSDRNRIELRDINDKVAWRYRNRLQFERPLSIGERKITPYFAGESMYDTRYDTWNRNQIYIGARVPIIKHVTFDGFYMKQWDARALPGFVNVFGVFWRLDF